MYGVHTVDVPRRPVAALEDVIGLPRTARLLDAAADFRNLSDSRVIWNVSSTESGGGVADMLQVLVGYTKDLAIDIRWSVIGGDGEFFRITKRLHNRIHGQLGDGGSLGAAERAHIEDVMAANVASLGDQISAGDLVLLHDPQTAGLVGPLSRRGAHVVWRSHIGIDGENDLSRSAWEFLQPLLDDADAFVFTRESYIPATVPASQAWIIQPSIDPFSPKNQPMDPDAVRAALVQMGVLAGDSAGPVCRYVRRDGSPGDVTQAASVEAEALPSPDDPVVVQVSRWDRLKDMVGVMRGFAEHVAPHGPGWLILAGPSVAGVTDDPEGATVFAETLTEWRNLPSSQRSRVMLVTLPMSDVDENGAMVNALQRHASVIVQKSLAEGFGLTVAEGMWKGRPVVGSAVGGIRDQIADGTGILLPDPTDLPAFGHAVRTLIDDTALADRMGTAAREHVRAHYVGDQHLLRYAELFGTLVANASTPTR
ncbi:MAG TPA: glycosyltransferase [Micromonosporaceae bacterium]|nr:glycosyltransferase [Micromonosporaceae bacterium]